MKKKRVNLYLSEDVKKVLDLQLKRYGMNYGNYFTHLIMQELEREERERQYRHLFNEAKIWT